MSDTNTPDPTAPASSWAERNYRSLKIAVIVMGILLVVGFFVVFGTIISRVASPRVPPDAAPVATVIPQDVAGLLGPDAEVVSTAIDGNRLALVLRRAEGLAVVVVDLRSGQIVNIIGAD